MTFNSLLRALKTLGSNLKHLVLRLILSRPRFLRKLIDATLWCLHSGSLTIQDEGAKGPNSTPSSSAEPLPQKQGRYDVFCASYIPPGANDVELALTASVHEASEDGLLSSRHSHPLALHASIPGAAAPSNSFSVDGSRHLPDNDHRTQSPNNADRPEAALGVITHAPNLNAGLPGAPFRPAQLEVDPTPAPSWRPRPSVDISKTQGIAPGQDDPVPRKPEVQYKPGTLDPPPQRYLCLIHPDQVPRYAKKEPIPWTICQFILQPMSVDLPHSFTATSGDWVPVHHPTGALYFYHPEWRAYTDMYVYDPALRAEVDAFGAYLAARCAVFVADGLPLPTDDFDLVLDVAPHPGAPDGTIDWKYYFVDHHARVLFWLDAYDAGDALLYEVHGPSLPGHVRIRLEGFYWSHWSLYPAGHQGREFPSDAHRELLGLLASGSIDCLTSKVSTVPFSVADMRMMFDLIKEANECGAAPPHVVISAARLLSIFLHWRFLHFHWQRVSRQDRYATLHAPRPHDARTRPFRALSFILFFAPEVHLRELKKLWTDKIVIEVFWREFVQRLVSEWIEFVLYSTVMLAANVAFLAIQGVIVVPADSSSAHWIRPSPAQITSSVSLVFSVGSIVTGLLLVRRHRTMARQGATAAAMYLRKQQSEHFGLEPLAVVFSLTYALLMWSVWAFFVALLLFSFMNTDTAIRVPMGSAAGITVLFVLGCVVYSRDVGETEKEKK
ncbi:hypothetical protein BC834DRAFT_886884 [Gloeopeniophorella convolvens]|nr:hypothetical protein BC834DRAFT_886884 [Gloeopeniophorella convolvens]